MAHKFTKHDYFETINEKSAYIIGFILGDGSIGINDSGNYFCSVSIHEQDIEVLEFIINEISPRPVGRHTQTQKSGLVTPYVRAKFTSNRLCQPLVDLGIIPKKTGKEIFPNIDAKYIPDFLRGLFDADGSLAMKRPKGRNTVLFNLSISSASIAILEDIQKYCGYGHVRKNHGCWSFEIARQQDICKFGKMIYYNNVNFCLKRKRDRFDLVPKPVLYLAFGEEKTIIDWAKDDRCVVHKDSIVYRLRNTNLSFEEALTTPQRTGKYKNLFSQDKVKNIIPRGRQVIPLDSYDSIDIN